MRRKASQAEAQNRVQEILALIRDGFTYSEIVRFCSEKWNISERQVEKYLRRAYDELRRMAEANFQEEFAKARMRLENLYQEARRSGKSALALSIQKEINRLHGLYPPEKQSIDMRVQGLFDLLAQLPDIDED